MKHIVKTDVPQFFVDDTKNLSLWSEYYAEKKRKLRTHILEKEQNYLCGYCESKVTLDNSHLEHIKPKSLDLNILTFMYDNILVSCNGKCHTSSTSPKSCGHKKLEEYNEALFLDPTQKEDIRDYFEYTNQGNIKSSTKDIAKANYMIEILELEPQNNHLQEARKKALEEFQKSALKNVETSSRNLLEIVQILLEKEDLAFISFLKFKYQI